MTLIDNLNMPTIRTIKQANKIIGGLSQTSKMNCFSFSIPAAECKQGSILRGFKGSVCSTCYALKGNYVRYPKIVKAQYHRLNSYNDNNGLWFKAMDYLFKNKKGMNYFRWFDSGDLQSAQMLKDIITLAEVNPKVNFWLPTKEKRIIENFQGLIPDNLTIRLSGSFIDGLIPKTKFNTSTVQTYEQDLICQAPNQGGECLECRKCWDKTVKNVSYLKH